VTSLRPADQVLAKRQEANCCVQAIEACHSLRPCRLYELWAVPGQAREQMTTQLCPVMLTDRVQNILPVPEENGGKQDVCKHANCLFLPL